MKFLRTLFTILLVVLVFAGIGWLAMQKGEVAYKGGGVDITLKPVIAVLILLGATILLSAIWGFVTWTISLPAKMKRAQIEGNRKKSLDLIGQVLSAHDAGDFSEARKLGQKLYSISSTEPANKLIYARASFVADDLNTAEKIYGELTEVAGYQSSALKGLAQIASQKGNFAAALSHAKSALEIAKKSTWPVEMMFKERINNSDWDGAISALDEAEKRGLIGKKTAQRRRAVALCANAHRLEKANEYNQALEMANRALKLAPSFAPAAIMAARLLKLSGKDWQAAQAIENAWTQEPHPALAIAYKDLKDGKSKKDILKWAEGLVKLRPDHRESRILQVEDAIANNEFTLADSILTQLVKERETSRVFALCAQAALLKKDTALYDNYMHKAAVAPREADWSDLDPQGNAFDYQNEDWARLIEVYGETGALIHPRLERVSATMLVKTPDAPVPPTAVVTNDDAPDELGQSIMGEANIDEKPNKKSWFKI
jgi:HemY protein